MNNREQNRFEQSIRQAQFPIDRIAFYRSAAAADNSALNTYESDPNTSFDWLRAQIARNNYLDSYFANGMIPEGMMKNEMTLLGWRYREE